MSKLRNKYLSTLHTARLLSNLMIFIGVLFVPAVWIWFEYLAVIDSEVVAKITQALAAVPLSKSGWLGIAAGATTIVFWAGYMLKSLVVLAETQLHDLSTAE